MARSQARKSGDKMADVKSCKELERESFLLLFGGKSLSEVAAKADYLANLQYQPLRNRRETGEEQPK